MMKKMIGSACMLIMLIAVSYGGIIATNENVPLLMDSDLGVAGDLATYVLDNYDENHAKPFVVGKDNAFNHLIMKNGSVSTNTVDNWYHMYIGQNAGASNNVATITGAGTELILATTYGAQTLYVGNSGANNTLEILDGARVSSTNTINIGSGGGNKFIIDNATFEGWNRFYICMAAGLDNYVSVRNGGYFYMPTTQRAEINASSTNLWFEVRDFQSVVDVHYMNFLGGYSNKVVLADQGLIKARFNANWVNYPRANSDVCFYGFAGGYFAWYGTLGQFDWNKYIRLWDGNDWVLPASLEDAQELGWSEIFYTDDPAGEAAALAATGYEGLAGYTVYTGGKPMYPDPPSGTVLIIQ